MPKTPQDLINWLAGSDSSEAQAIAAGLETIMYRDEQNRELADAALVQFIDWANSGRYYLAGKAPKGK